MAGRPPIVVPGIAKVVDRGVLEAAAPLTDRLVTSPRPGQKIERYSPRVAGLALRLGMLPVGAAMTLVLAIKMAPGTRPRLTAEGRSLSHFATGGHGEGARSSIVNGDTGQGFAISETFDETPQLLQWIVFEKRLNATPRRAA